MNDQEQPILADPKSRYHKGYVVASIIHFVFLSIIILIADLGVGRWVFLFTSMVPLGDKIAHCVFLGLWSFFLNSAFYCRRTVFFHLSIHVGSGILVLVSLVEEFSQLFIKGRTPDLLDLTCNLIGIFLFGYLAERNQKIRSLNNCLFKQICG